MPESFDVAKRHTYNASKAFFIFVFANPAMPEPSKMEWYFPFRKTWIYFFQTKSPTCFNTSDFRKKKKIDLAIFSHPFSFKFGSCIDKFTIGSFCNSVQRETQRTRALFHIDKFKNSIGYSLRIHIEFSHFTE